MPNAAGDGQQSVNWTLVWRAIDWSNVAITIIFGIVAGIVNNKAEPVHRHMLVYDATIS